MFRSSAAVGSPLGGRKAAKICSNHALLRVVRNAKTSEKGKIMAITDQLLQIANAARIVPLGDAKLDVGVPISFGLTPAFPTSLDTLQAGDVSAIWLTKDVRFADALGAPAGTALATYLSDSNQVLGGQPVVDPGLSTNLDVPLPIVQSLLTLPKITNTVTDPPTPPATDLAAGTPGILGQFTGAVPIPIQVPVSIEIIWTVKKGRCRATLGTDFVAPKGLTGPVLDLIFLATPAELKEGFSPLVQFEISATVEVKALGLTSGPVPLPPITLDVPAVLGIPMVVALFRHPNYSTEGGRVLVVVPQNAVFQTVDKLAPVLDTLRQTITRLQSFQRDAVSGNFATFLLGLGTLLDALDAQPESQFAVGNIRNLHDIRFREHGWRVFPPQAAGDENPDDITSSMILIGFPSKGIKLWGDPGFSDTGDDKLSLELFAGGEMWATIRTFNFSDDQDLVVFPPSAVAGTLVNRNHKPFNDRISSIQFIDMQ